jgi:2-dehydropantoate 2-reductase
MKEETKKTIGVVGMGPVGQILAVYLKEAGCNVVLCDRGKEKINLIRKEGITLEGVIRKHAYFKNVFTSMDDLMVQKPEILFFAVKAHHMPSLLAPFKELAEATKMSIVSAQNGIDVEQIASETFGESQTLRMVLNFAGNLHAPNVVNVTFFNPPNYIASVDDSKIDVAKWIASTLSEVSLDTEALSSFRITDKIWEKTILNAAMSPLCGISKLTISEAMNFADAIEIVEQIIMEGIEVAKAEEIKFPENFVKLCMRYLKRAGNHFPSLAVDMINNRETEIDYFNGRIVEYGKKHYIRTPLNLTFTNLVKAASYRNTLTQQHRKSFNETIADI